jgi:tetratricopeptide (TPR) repeat protein
LGEGREEEWRPSIRRAVASISEKVIHTDITCDMAETLLDTFGTTSSDFVHAELSRLPGEQREINAALAAIDGTRPETELAAMLASQMVVTHGLAMDMLGRVRRADLLVQAEALGALATKLLRTYTMQMEVFRRAIEANRNFPSANFNLAAALAQLGRLDEAHSAVIAGLALNPSFAVSPTRAAWTAMSDDKTYLARLEPYLEGLRKAGIPEQ